MAEGRRRLHVGAFLGLSAGAYALSLGAITALQAQADSAVMAERDPAAQAIAALAAQNRVLESDARDAVVAYGRATTAYDLAGSTLADVEAQLARLVRVVTAVDGAARALPDHVTLPKITTRTVTTAKPRTVHATTGASGG